MSKNSDCIFIFQSSYRLVDPGLNYITIVMCKIAFWQNLFCWNQNQFFTQRWLLGIPRHHLQLWQAVFHQRPRQRRENCVSLLWALPQRLVARRMHLGQPQRPLGTHGRRLCQLVGSHPHQLSHLCRDDG